MKTTIKLFLSEFTTHAGFCLLIYFFLFSKTATGLNLTVDNSVLKWSDGTMAKIVEANSPETPFHFNDYAWMNWLRSKGVNTLYCTTNGTDGGITTTPYINNNQNSGFDNVKVDQWVAMSNYWVNTLWNGKGIMHILLSEKETHDKYTAATQKQIMSFLVQKFSPVAGNIIWDREEYPNGRTSQINDLYAYLKSIDSDNLRGMHNNTSQNPWSDHYNSDLIQFLSFQESTNSFNNRIRTEVLKFTQQITTGYASEMTGGFQTNDIAKAETVFNAAQPYNAGVGVYISCCDQRNTSDNWYRAYEPVYTRLAQLAGNSVNVISGCTDPNATNYNPSATVDDGSCQTCNGTLDCNNVCNGNAQTDSCGICAGGNTGITPCASSSNAIRFWLVNASNNAILFEITDNMTFSNSTGINVVVDGPGVQATVRMFYDGQQTSFENTAPFSVFGDNNGNYNPASFTPGSHSIRAEIEGTTRVRTVYFTAGASSDLCATLNCDDANPCTIDGCNSGVCTYQPDPGCNGSCIQLEVVSFTLVHTDGSEIGTLVNGTEIDLLSIGNFSIRADVCNNPVGSVRFTLNGNILRTENGIPYSIHGDSNGNFAPWNPSPGNYTLTATPYSGSGGGGTTGISEIVNFTVAEQQSPGCTGNLQCDDNNPCTVDNCVSGQCANTLLNCDDADACTIDACNNGVCAHQHNPDCNESCTQAEVTAFVLVNASNGTQISELVNGMVIDKSSIVSFSIRTDMCDAPVGSVRFILNGSIVRTENYAPYSLKGDYNDGATYIPWNPAPGNYTLTGTPYSSFNGNGTTGVSLTVTFSVVATPSGCSTDRAQCNDNNACTVDDCISNQCISAPIDCDDDNSCTIEICNNGVCVHQTDPDCNQFCTQPEVVSFTLVRASNGTEISQLINGMVINKSILGNFSVRANACGEPLGSVRFTLNRSIIQTENYAPYSINSDFNNGATYTPWNPNPGYYTLQGMPYSATNGSGTAGVSETVSFTITNSAAKMEGSELIEDEVVSPPHLFGDLKIYPNPFTDELMLDCTSENEGTARFRILNSLGQTVATETIKFQNGENKKILSLDKTLPGGIYLLELDYDAHTEYRKIFKLGLQ